MSFLCDNLNKNSYMHKTKEVYFFENNGKCYIREWLNNLDQQIRARINNRISRLEYSIYGDYKYIDNGIYELRFFFGSGYRVYFTEESNKIIIVLCGGDKDSQQKDVKKAQELLREYLKES